MVQFSRGQLDQDLPTVCINCCLKRHNWLLRIDCISNLLANLKEWVGWNNDPSGAIALNLPLTQETFVHWDNTRMDLRKTWYFLCHSTIHRECVQYPTGFTTEQRSSKGIGIFPRGCNNIDRADVDIRICVSSSISQSSGDNKCKQSSLPFAMKLFDIVVLASAFGQHLLCSAKSNRSTTLSSHQILPANFKPPQVFKNVNLLRSINLEKGYVKEVTNLVIENTDKKPQSEYFLPFRADEIGNVGGLEVKDKKEPEKPAFSCETVEYDPYR